MDDWTRAAYHEAGHTVVGLHFGFRVDKIEVIDHRPTIMCDMDSHEPAERFLFLAGGIAGEKFFEPASDYDRVGSGKDQIMITERGGGSIEEYLPKALDVLHSHEKFLRSIQAQLKKQFAIFSAKARMTASFGIDPNRPVQLLSGQVIIEMWAGGHEA